MQVWIVTHSWEEEINGNEYSTWHNNGFVGVFSTKEKAEARVRQEENSDHNYFSVEEWELA